MSDRVEEIRERVEKASAPWDLYVEGKGGGARIESLGREIPADWGLFREPPPMAEDDAQVWMGKPTAFTSTDAAFIANAPSDIRFLLSEVERLRRVEKEARIVSVALARYDDHVIQPMEDGVVEMPLDVAFFLAELRNALEQHVPEPVREEMER